MDNEVSETGMKDRVDEIAPKLSRRRSKARIKSDANAQCHLVVSSIPEGEHVQAYAILRGSSFHHYVRKLAVSVGKGVKRGVDVHLGHCSSITRRHFDIVFNWSIRRWEVIVLGKSGVLLNTVPFSLGCPPIVLKSRDVVQVPCDSCANPHALFFLLPKGCPDRGLPNMCDYVLQGKLQREPRAWTDTERERFQRAFLSLGYHRPMEVKRAAGLSKRTVHEVEEFSKAFLVEVAKQADGEEKQYVETLVQMENLTHLPDGSPRPELTCLSTWKKLRRSATAWGRRIRSMHYLQEAIRLHEIYGRDLLAGIDLSGLQPQPPAEWWSAADDRMLLIGTHRNGYARHDDIRLDTTLKFSRSTADPTWPSTDQITRRLKKLVEAGRLAMLRLEGSPVPPRGRRGKREEKNMPAPALLDSEEMPVGGAKAQNWTKRQKNEFMRALMTYGLQRAPDGRIDWIFLKRKCHLQAKWDLTLTKMYRSFVAEAERIGNETEGASAASENDNFMTKTVASKFRKRLRLLRLLRTSVLPHPKIKRIIKLHAPTVSSTLPSWWKIGTSDLSLLIGVDRHGIGQWRCIFADKSLRWPAGVNFDNCPKSEALFKRTRVLVHSLAQYCVKAGKTVPTSSKLSKPPAKSKVEPTPALPETGKANEGTVIEPGLMVVSLGDVSSLKESDPVHFPIGYNSIRTESLGTEPETSCRFICKVEAGADSSVMFVVECIEPIRKEHISVRRRDIDIAWHTALQEARERADAQLLDLKKNTNGVELFGLSHPRVVEMMKDASKKKTHATQSPPSSAQPIPNAALMTPASEASSVVQMQVDENGSTPTATISSGVKRSLSITAESSQPDTPRKKARLDAEAEAHTTS